ncbi:MAG TPA: hypothetical protein VG206_01130, partial [Terriglobia bacterium]|nr:hypothetical protein [Terriglobia bacterium]
SAQWVGTADVLHIQRIELEFTDGEKKLLSEEAHAMTYYVNSILIQFRSEQGTLNELVQYHSPRFLGDATDIFKDHVIACPAGTRVIGPADGEIPLKHLDRVHVRAGTAKAKAVTGPVMFDPYLLVPDVRVQNVATGEEQTFSRHSLALGLNTVFARGEFYEQPTLATYYYCDDIAGDLAKLYLVESFQLGRLIQAEFTVKTENAKFYVPVSDKAVIQRLRRRLDRLKVKPAKRVIPTR